MIIKITELCQHNGGEGLRTIHYKAPRVNTLLEALIEYEKNFNSENILSSNDHFDEEASDNEIIYVEKAHWY